MPDFVNVAVEYIRQLPMLIKFIFLVFAVLIEYIFPLFPGDTIVLLSGFLNAHGALDLLEISIAIIVGSILGALLGYGIGHLMATKRTKYPWLQKFFPEEALAKWNKWYRKWGTILLLVNRFFPGIRAIFFVAAGAAKVPLVKVLVLGGLSAILFNGCLIVVGYWLGFNAELILTYFYRYNAIALILIMLVIALFVAFFFWQKKRRS